MVGGKRWSRFGKLLHINLLKNLSITGDWEYGRRRVQIWFDKSTEEEGRGQWHQWFPFLWNWKVPLERWFACLRWRTTEAHNDLLAGCRNQVIPLKMPYKSYSGTNWKLLMRWIFAGRQIIYWFRMSIFWRRPKILGALWFNVNWGFFPPSQTGGLKRKSLKKIEILLKGRSSLKLFLERRVLMVAAGTYLSKAHHPDLINKSSLTIGPYVN